MSTEPDTLIDEDAVSRFEAAWRAGTPEPIERFLPPPDHPQFLGTLRELVLIEIEMTYRSRSGASDRTLLRLDAYLQRFPMLDHPDLVRSLVQEEIRGREHAGERPDLEEYRRRFPQLTLVDTLADRKIDLVDFEREKSIDDFDLLRLLGKGSFAQVFLAWQRSMQRLVALKVSAVRGLEPQTLAQLDHPHVVRVFDQRLLPERNLLLLYMDYAPGGTLQSVREHVRKIAITNRTGADLVAAIDQARGESKMDESRRAVRQRLSAMTWPQAVCWLGARLAEALHYAHGKGVLHRDIKPANVLFTAEGLPLLADFNVGACETLTGEALFGGSLGFMAPEHLEAVAGNLGHDKVGPRADIYSLGVTLWELLGDTTPFAVEKSFADPSLAMVALIVDRRAGVDPKKEARLAALAPPEVIATLKKCLAPDPERRYASALELARDLDQCVHPQAQALLRLAPRGVLASMRRWPVAWLVLMGLLPNVIVSLFNISYNHAAVIAHHPNAERPFATLIPIFNAIFFGVGFAIVLRRAWPVATLVGRLTRGPGSSAVADAIRARDLTLAGQTSIVCIACWAIAGVLWPIGLDRMLDGELTLQDHLHFLASLVMCGLMAASYTFFLIAWVAVRGFLPVLWPGAGPHDRAAFETFSRHMTAHLGLAFAAPLLGIVILSLVQHETPAALFAMRVLSAAGLAGALLALAIERRLRRAVEILAQLLAPS